MADIAITAAQVEAIDPLQAEIYNFIAAETITQGQVVYILAAGTVGVADATTAGGLYQARGIALNGGAAGQAISVLKRVHGERDESLGTAVPERDGRGAGECYAGGDRDGGRVRYCGGHAGQGRDRRRLCGLPLARGLVVTRVREV